MSVGDPTPDPLEALGVFGPIVREAINQVKAEFRAELEVLRAELTSPNKDPRRCLSPDEICEIYGFSRSTFDRWLADRHTGLEEVVQRPRGGRLVLVPRAEFEDWLAGQCPGRRAGSVRAMRRAQ